MASSPKPESSELELLAELIHEHTGLSFELNRQHLLAEKLITLFANGKYSSYLDLYYFLKYGGPETDQEWLKLQSLLAVNETYFWREFDQIREISHTIIPMLQAQQPGRSIRIWHAACATGEEPYTMAIALRETGGYARGPIEITATDFNQEALVLALEAQYRSKSMRHLPPDMLQRYFRLDGKNMYRLSDAIRSKVKFQYLNLFDETAMSGMRNYDIILCRNAFIYFSDKAIKQVADGFYRSLNPNGYLFLAAAESLLRLNTKFELVEINGAFGYRK